MELLCEEKAMIRIEKAIEENYMLIPPKGTACI
jgi:hypothetical protein